MRIPTVVVLLAGGLAGCRPSPAAQVVFVCEHGAAKSVVAAAYFNKLAAERGLAVKAVARGAAPQAGLANSAVKGLSADGLAPGLDAPRALTAEDVRRSTQVITFDCDQPTMKGLLGMGLCWGDVPAVGEDYVRARDLIRAHVEMLAEQMASSRK